MIGDHFWTGHSLTMFAEYSREGFRPSFRPNFMVTGATSAIGSQGDLYFQATIFG